MTVYTVALPKGGSTKTTTAAELAVLLARRGRRVLAIDLDQQGNLTTRMGVTPDTEVAAVAADVITGDAPADEAAIDAPTAEGVEVLPGTHDLATVEAQPPPDLVTSLRDHLPAVHGRWDDIVIDTPPSLSGLTLAGLAAADEVVVPLTCATECLDQLARLEGIIATQLARRVRPGLTVRWVVPTRYDARRILDREVVDLLTEKYNGRVTPPVREAVAVRDAYSASMTVSVFHPGSTAALDYGRVVDTILGEGDR
jgi:chromosome partitioning protein